MVVAAAQPVMLGVFWFLLFVFSPLALLALGVWVPRAVEALRDRRAMRLRAGRAHGPPLEKLVADLRRLRSELVSDPPTTNAQHTGLLMAYDSVLRDTCARLELPTGLGVEPAGPGRDLERLLAEAAIQEAGIPLHAPRRRGAQP